MKDKGIKLQNDMINAEKELRENAVALHEDVIAAEKVLQQNALALQDDVTNTEKHVLTTETHLQANSMSLQNSMINRVESAMNPLSPLASSVGIDEKAIMKSTLDKIQDMIRHALNEIRAQTSISLRDRHDGQGNPVSQFFKEKLAVVNNNFSKTSESVHSAVSGGLSGNMGNQINDTMLGGAMGGEAKLAAMVVGEKGGVTNMASELLDTISNSVQTFLEQKILDLEELLVAYLMEVVTMVIVSLENNEGAAGGLHVSDAIQQGLESDTIKQLDFTAVKLASVQQEIITRSNGAWKDLTDSISGSVQGGLQSAWTYANQTEEIPTTVNDMEAIEQQILAEDPPSRANAVESTATK